MENQFNGKPIEYGQRFEYLPEMNTVTQYNFDRQYQFFMEDSTKLGEVANPIAVWRIKQLKN